MVLTYSDSRPGKDWVLRTDANLDGDSLSYLDMLERNSAEERRRQRERTMMEEGRAMWKQKKTEDLELELKDQEKIRELSQMRLFGRPGHGAPTENIRKKKFTEMQLSDQDKAARAANASLTDWQKFAAESAGSGSADYNGNPNPVQSGGSANNPGSNAERVRHKTARNLNEMSPDFESQDSAYDALSFGRPGCGAPVRTKSGRLRTTLRGNPEIRFQNDETVRKVIYNSIRYQGNPELKAQYQRDLEEQIRARKERDRVEREANRSGWCGSSDPRKRQPEIKAHEVEDLKREMDEIRHKKAVDHYEQRSEVGVELVPLLKAQSTGKPKKDPATGYLMNHALPTTDVTKLADPKREEQVAYPAMAKNGAEGSDGVRKHYYNSLNNQVQEREIEVRKLRAHDHEEQMKHFQNWDTFWGRPGYGAPKEGRLQKENLMKSLYYPEKAPNNVELITLERLPVK